MQTCISKFNGAAELVRMAWNAYSASTREMMSRSVKKWILFLHE